MSILSKRIASFIVHASILAAFLVAAEPGLAELGGTMSGVHSDQTQMRAQLKSVTHANHVHNEFTLPNGGAVTEFTNNSGQVFAVTWSGPGKPDLRRLLGVHFATLQADNAIPSGRALRRPAQVNRSDIMIQTGGHMGYFWGVAYIPSLAPKGFSVNDLQ